MATDKVLVTPLCGIERSGWLNPALLTSLVAMSHDSRFQVVIEPAFGLSPVDFARNQCVASARNRGFDWLLTIDNDQTLPPEPFSVLNALSQAGPRQDVVGFACGISLDGGKRYERNSAMLEGVTDGAFYGVSKIGAGVLALRNSVWQTIPTGPWFRTLQNQDEMLSLKQSEDLYFCDLARAAGLQLWMSQLGAGHIKSINLTTLLRGVAA
jgi:hypothetical protein